MRLPPEYRLTYLNPLIDRINELIERVEELEKKVVANVEKEIIMPTESEVSVHLPVVRKAGRPKKTN